MHLTKHIVAIVVAVIVALTVLSCNNDTCNEGTRALLKTGLYRAGTTTTLTVDSLSVYGAGAPGDTMVVDTSAVSQFRLPLRPNVTECKFIVDYCAKAYTDIHDEITINYEPIPYFVSHECGAMFYFRINNVSYTTAIIDSVAVTDSLITNIDKVSMQIFLRTE